MPPPPPATDSPSTPTKIMKKILLLLVLVIAVVPAAASPVTGDAIAIANPKIGQAPSVNHFAASGTPFYRMTWRTVIDNGSSVNFLTGFSYSGSQLYTSDSAYAATTYVEMQTKATALGITNLPAKVTGQP